MSTSVETSFDRFYNEVQENFTRNNVKHVVKEASEWRRIGIAAGSVAVGTTCILAKVTYSYWPYAFPLMFPLVFCSVIANDSYRWVKMTTRVIKAAEESHEQCVETKNKAQWAMDVEREINRSVVFRSMFKHPINPKKITLH